MSRFLYWFAFVVIIAASSPAVAQPFPDCSAETERGVYLSSITRNLVQAP